MNLPTIRQVQIVADLLKTAAVPDHVPVELLDEPWRAYCQWCVAWIKDAVAANPHNLDEAFYREFAPQTRAFENHYQLFRQAMDEPIVYPSAERSLSEIGALRWLWRGWLLRGVPSILAAVPGTGKSYLALDLARRIIAGEPFPDGDPSTPCAKPDGPDRAVLYVDAENTPVIHKERVSVWPEAVLRGLYFMLPAPDRFLINLDDHSDRDRLCDMAWCIRPTLIIVDSYGSSTLKGENSKEDVQVLLAFLNQLARDFDCGLLIIHHLRKNPSVQPNVLAPMTIDSIRGSSHIAAMARHIWGLQFVPTEASSSPGPDNPRRMWIIKTNVGAPPEPLGVQFLLHPDNPKVAQLAYGDAPQPYRRPTRAEECADWILGELEAAGEPLKPADLIQRGKRRGIYKALIFRARKQLGDRVTDTLSYRHPHNAWALPEWGSVEVDGQ